ncbi:hypothetical protein [Xenorhabdus bovienii]|uniref:hypothetical protein n=1 Tax=Xenorhabdus bovienii TaxID=40576 RepID=UPI00237CE6B3|nr:hypothetical protein [Xenorhabdus bovienii]MDE1474753.1 hypothetical protein [Xenorhabdus bovienii]MDE1493148.1 hypothetical protein [Xenorhabdus bovienii]
MAEIEKRGCHRSGCHGSHPFHVADGLGGDALSRTPVRLSSRDGKPSIAVAGLAVKPLHAAGLGQPEDFSGNATQTRVPGTVDPHDDGQPAVSPAV